MAADAPVSPPAPGLLFVWTNADPAHEDDFNRWYDREHLEERVRMQVMSVAYRRAFQHQTPWSLTDFGRTGDSMRRVCTVATAAGSGRGAWLAAIRQASDERGGWPAERQPRPARRLQDTGAEGADRASLRP
jgi:hypothetical protein